MQIHGREVVSASGDRHIKVWDWPTQSCTRTIVGHTKGIACVQYDGRRIVSGSSDNEVKVFDRQTGLEVASLRSHSNLVRTVQAGFGDLPYSAEDDAVEAKKVDAEYFKALESGRLGDTDHPRPKGRRQGNAGSKRPEDICAYGAKLPPGGGGGKYGRIISGSYDTSIIIWRRDKEGIWKAQHHLKQEEAAVAARGQARTQTVPPVTIGGIPLHPSMRAGILAPNGGQIGGAPPPPGAVTGEASSTNAPPAATGTASRPSLPASMQITSDQPIYPMLTPTQIQQCHHLIDQAVQQGHMALARALATHPPLLTQRSYLEAAIDRQPSPVVRSQLRQAFSAALIRAQFEQARQRREAIRNQESLAMASNQAMQQGQGQTQTATAGVGSGPGTTPRPAAQTTPAQMAAAATAAAAAAAHQAHAQLLAPAHGVHLHQVPTPLPLPPLPPLPPPVQTTQVPIRRRTRDALPPIDAANPARVFKLQYDARRIICCSQTSVIVGWDFCNGDPELEEASRFFGHVQ